MATVTDTWTGSLADGSALDGTEVEGYLTDLQAGTNSVAEAQLDWTTSTGLRAAAAVRKVIAGSDAFDMNNTGIDILTVVFADDGHDTPSVFSSATDLVVTTSLEVDGTGIPLVVRLASLTVSGFTATINTADDTNSAATGTLHFIAIGRA